MHRRYRSRWLLKEHRSRLKLYFALLVPLWLMTAGCRQASDAASMQLGKQAAELQQLALEKARANWPKVGQPYAEQWAKGIGQAVQDTDAQMLSAQRMAALRVAVSDGVEDNPKTAVPEYYAWLAAAARYNYGLLVRLPDLTPSEQKLLDSQVNELGRYVRDRAERFSARLVPDIAPQVADDSQAEFLRRATETRANPNGIWLKAPLTEAQLASVKSGFDEAMAAYEKMPRQLLVAPNPSARVVLIRVRVQGAIWSQFGRIYPDPVYPDDVKRLEKAYVEANRRQRLPR